MRILVISDSHGRRSAIEDVIEAQSEAKHIFFLGDCTKDIEDCVYLFPDRIFHIVAGNCDDFSEHKWVDTVFINNKKILFTHGHTFSVKSGLEKIKTAARQANAQIVLFGHTHLAITDYDEGCYFVNPGSLSHGALGYRSYAVVDILDNGIKPIIIKI